MNTESIKSELEKRKEELYFLNNFYHRSQIATTVASTLLKKTKSLTNLSNDSGISVDDLKLIIESKHEELDMSLLSKLYASLQRI